MRTSLRSSLTVVMATMLVGPSLAAQSEPSAAEPSPTASAVAIAMPLLVGCSHEVPCPLSAGRWALSGQYSFILGMEISLPDGWESHEQDAGEFNLYRVGDPETAIVMVKDIAAVINDGSGDLAPGIPRTAEGLTSFWQEHPDLVVTEPTPTTIAGGIPASTFVIGISPDAQSGDALCPSNPLCADLFIDPRYWDAPFGYVAPYVARFYLATIGNGDGEHVLAIILMAADAAALEHLTEEARPMIDSIRLPDTFPIW
jgi:hypothetical protein